MSLENTINSKFYEDGIRQMVQAGMFEVTYVDTGWRILNTCLANHILSEEFIREIWDFIPVSSIIFNYGEKYFTEDFLREIKRHGS